MTRNRWTDLSVLVIYLATALVITWPLAINLDSHFPGDSNDSLHHYWNGWWVKRALNTGQSPYWTPYLHYPHGLSLVSHDIAWFNIGMWLVLEPLLGGYVAYNWGILISLVACGFAAFLLAYELTGDVRSAFLAGLLYQSWPFRMHQLDRPNLAGTQWIPLFILFLWQSMDRGKWWQGVLAGVFLALTGYTRWQQLIPAAILGGLFLICTVPRKLGTWRRWGPALLLAGTVAAVALAPPVVLLARQQRSDPVELLRPTEESTMQTDVLAYFTPSRFHSFLRSLTQPAYARYYADRSEPRRYPAYVGVTAFGLAVVGVWSSRRKSLPWVVMAGTLILLSLGPELRFNGRLYPDIPMPYRLAARLQFVRLIRLPDRFNLFLALPAAMLAAYGVSHLLDLVQRRRRVTSLVLSGGLGAALLLEYLVAPIPLHSLAISPFYGELAEDGSEFAILNLPLDQKVSKQYMFAQATHQHPIVQGHVSRFPQGAFDYMTSQPWIRALQDSGHLPPAHIDVGRQLRTLAQDGVEYVVVHKKLNPHRIQHWRNYFLTTPRFEDDALLVFPTAPLSGRDFTVAEELAPGVGIVSATLSAECLGPGQPFWVDVGWGAIASPHKDWAVRLRLVSETGTTWLDQSETLSEVWPTGEWPANTIAKARYRVDSDVGTPSGVYRVMLSLTDLSSPAGHGRETHLGDLTVSRERCRAFAPRGSTGVNALFGSKLRLLGYRLRHREDGGPVPGMDLTLLWRSEQLMDTDYKVSVEVLDPDSGRPVARDDAMPVRWAYRTSYWGKGEVVTDVIPLSMENVPAGLYNVAVTVYNPDSGKRLPVLDSGGDLQPRGRTLLPDQGDAGVELLVVEVGVSEHPIDLASLEIPYGSEREIIPQLRLLGYDVTRKALLAGDEVSVQLFWEAVASVDRDYRVRLALVDLNGESILQEDYDVVAIDYPTSRWRAGDILEDWYSLATDRELPSGEVALALNLVDEAGDSVLADPVNVTRLWIQGVKPRFERPPLDGLRDSVSLEDKVALLGYDASSSVERGGSATVTLYWQALRTMNTSYKVFVHLYDAAGAIVSQRDRLPGLGARPTTSWERGEIVADRYFVRVDGETPPGAYQLAVGLYDPQSGERLMPFDADGERLAQDRIPIGWVEVEP
ncbi:MAG: hypothetical protein PVH41_00450 [Anaerolineae bacterium]